MAGSLFRKKSIDKILRDAQNSTAEHGSGGLKRILSVKDLTFLGIAAVVGAGVFSTIGSAAADGGPGISLLFVITAVTCGFSALCYAEFASRVPIAGSAYTYAYVTFGELIAWIIGWALILEYAIGNIVVAISWSTYFNNLLMDVGLNLPGWLTVDPATAEKAFKEVTALQATGVELSRGQHYVLDAYNNAPILFGSKFFLNIPAFIIVALISCLTYVGIKESKRSANYMVIFKIAVVIFVIIVGAFYVKPGNWTPFMPNGFEGVLKGVSAVFYAYIGFDAISTTAEEAKNPQRDLPRGMIYSLVICTILYILIALVLTGMVPSDQLRVNDPLAFVFDKVGAEWISKIVSISAVVATTSVLLVFQLGQPRIWMSMSRDGLLPKAFGKVHKKYHTPYFSTIVTGILVAVPSLFMQSSRMTDLTSIGTLFAFVLVSGGVLLLPKIEAGTDTRPAGGFRLPYVNGQFIVPIMVAVFIYLFHERIGHAAANLGTDKLQELLFLTFVLLAVIMALLTFIKKYSLIPVLGVLFCAYLLIEIPAISWIWFFCWMGLGLLIYFMYGYRNSNLAKY